MLDQPPVIPTHNQVPTQETRQVSTSNEQNINSLSLNSDPELSDLLEEIMDLWNVNSGKKIWIHTLFIDNRRVPLVKTVKKVRGNE